FQPKVATRTPCPMPAFASALASRRLRAATSPYVERAGSPCSRCVTTGLSAYSRSARQRMPLMLSGRSIIVLSIAHPVISVCVSDLNAAAGVHRYAGPATMIGSRPSTPSWRHANAPRTAYNIGMTTHTELHLDAELLAAA